MTFDLTKCFAWCICTINSCGGLNIISLSQGKNSGVIVSAGVQHIRHFSEAAIDDCKLTSRKDIIPQIYFEELLQMGLLSPW